MINKQLPAFGAEICSDICPRTLSVPRSERTVLGERSFDENFDLLVVIYDLSVVDILTNFFIDNHNKAYWGLRS